MHVVAQVRCYKRERRAACRGADRRETCPTTSLPSVHPSVRSANGYRRIGGGIVLDGVPACARQVTVRGHALFVASPRHTDRGQLAENASVRERMRRGRVVVADPPSRCRRSPPDSSEATGASSPGSWSQARTTPLTGLGTAPTDRLPMISPYEAFSTQIQITCLHRVAAPPVSRTALSRYRPPQTQSAPTKPPPSSSLPRAGREQPRYQAA